QVGLQVWITRQITQRLPISCNGAPLFAAAQKGVSLVVQQAAAGDAAVDDFLIQTGRPQKIGRRLGLIKGLLGLLESLCQVRVELTRAADGEREHDDQQQTVSTTQRRHYNRFLSRNSCESRSTSVPASSASVRSESAEPP